MDSKSNIKNSSNNNNNNNNNNKTSISTTTTCAIQSQLWKKPFELEEAKTNSPNSNLRNISNHANNDIKKRPSLFV